MAQRISQLPSEAIPYAQEALPYSSLKRGLGSMNQVNAGMSNQQDGGNFSKPYANAQEQRNRELAMQDARQNGITAQPQAVVAATGQARKQMTEMSSQDSRSKQYMNHKLADQVEQLSSAGQSIRKLNGLMTGPYADAFKNDIAVSTAMYQKGQAPELGQLKAEADRYVG